MLKYKIPQIVTLTPFLFVLLYYKTKGWPQTKKPVLDERVYP